MQKEDMRKATDEKSLYYASLAPKGPKTYFRNKLPIQL